MLFFNPILNIIRKLGGSVNATEVIEIFDISDELLAEKYKNGVLKIDIQIAWVRVYLIESKFIVLDMILTYRN